MNLVIVESPAKAKTINKYLGSDYEVLASYGHVRDLPSKDGSVLPDDDFSMHWEADAKGAKRLSEIAEAAKRADRVILATDPDREGEAISWHVLEVLNKKKALKDTHVERVTFNAITKSAVLEAMANPRQIDMELVEAYLARRALDYLVGFTLSPVLWRKLPGARSAGRVQSVALRIVVDREMEIEKFKAQEYWSIEADLNADSPPFTARLVKHAGKRIQRLDIPTEEMAFAARDAIKAGDFTIKSVEKKPAKRSPAPPFTTSTLQQEAARKLGFSAQRTMQAAQKLYEGVDETGGLITYMRTDGVQTTPEGIAQAREVISQAFGPAFVPQEPRYYKTKAKNAQEAHEAIRPTNIARHPDSLRLESDLQRLYELIWKRMVASQMEAARMDRTTVDIETADGQTGLRATGQVVTFDGFLAVYEEGRDEKQKGAEEDESDDTSRLPALKEGAKAGWTGTNVKGLETWAIKRADHVFTICEGLRADIVGRGIPAAKVTVIPNAVDIESFQLSGDADPVLRAQLGLAGTTVVGFVGSFYAYEGLDLASTGNNLDTDRLALHSLEHLPGWTGQVRLEVRQYAFDGPLLDSMGAVDAPSRKCLVLSEHGDYQAFDSDGQQLHGDDSLYASLLQALPDSERVALDMRIGEAEKLDLDGIKPDRRGIFPASPLGGQGAGRMGRLAGGGCGLDLESPGQRLPHRLRA